MKLRTSLLAQRYYSNRLIFFGLVSLLAITTVKGSLAQDSQQQDGVYMPIVISGQAENHANDQQDDHEDDHGDDHDHLHIGHILEEGRFTTNNSQEVSWPPQIKYIKDVAWDTNAIEIGASQETAEKEAKIIAESTEEIQELVGERFTHISTQAIQEKWQEAIQGYKITYFSYSNNITIEAIVADYAVEKINTFTAAEYQPPLRQNEVEDAINIARRYWQDQGNSRVDALQGFAIQTFQTDGDGGYYDTRMSYVSFHLDAVSEPELLTWIDLTDQTVVRAAVDQGGTQYEQ